MTIDVAVVSETLLSGQRALAMQGRFEMVAVDDHGHPTPIPAAASSNPHPEDRS